MDKDQIIIIGAGIAGLSLAIQLAENKIPCIVLEKRQSPGEVTSGVRISSQGVRVLEKLKITNIGEKTERTILYFGNIQANFKNRQAIVVTRLALFEKLLERAKKLEINIVSGFEVVNAVESSNSVEVISETGQRISGSFLVGADGVGSILRKLLNQSSYNGKTYAGYLGVGLITPSDAKIEMSIYYYPKNRVGAASLGKINSKDTNNNIFLWTHFYMPEGEANAMTREKVLNELKVISSAWHPQLKNIFSGCVNDPTTTIAFGPVYNGKLPSKWFSEKMILIGDAAHPYGPGGQGISMALKDAEALCKLLLHDNINQKQKEAFQKSRSKEAQKLGESAEARNRPENQIRSKWRIFVKGIVIKCLHFFSRGRLK